LKIIYLYQYFGTPKGSWSTRVYELTRRWVEAGHDVTVITSPYDKSDIKADGLVSFQQVNGIKLVIINSGDSNRMAIWKRVIRALQFSVISSFFTLKLDADVIIASSGPITIGIPGLIGKFFKRLPLVFEVRDLWPDGGIEMGIIKNHIVIKLSKWFESYCYLNSKLIIPCSVGMDSFIKRGFQRKKTTVIPNASDVSLFQTDSKSKVEFPSWLHHNTKILLYTGSLGFMDSCMEIIEGFNQLENKADIHIIFIGDGVERMDLERRVKELNLDSYIHFTGLISKHEVVAWYKRAIASFVVFKNYPVLSTSSPNKMFDSFAAGVPIIQNTEGWIKDLIDIESCGINVMPNNAFSMMKAIKIVVTEDRTQKHLSQNALRLAKSEFNRDLLAQKYLNALTEIVQA
jgi:glycosyltransferase involved in cell wall biosynthesis